MSAADTPGAEGHRSSGGHEVLEGIEVLEVTLAAEGSAPVDWKRIEVAETVPIEVADTVPTTIDVAETVRIEDIQLDEQETVPATIDDAETVHDMEASKDDDTVNDLAGGWEDDMEAWLRKQQSMVHPWINWNLFGNFDAVHERVDELVKAPLSEVAEIKVGITESPVWRMTGHPDLRRGKCSMIGHEIRFANMECVFTGFGYEAADLETSIINSFKGHDKVVNERPGGDGPINRFMVVYILHNNLEELVNFRSSERKRWLKGRTIVSKGAKP